MPDIDIENLNKEKLERLATVYSGEFANTETQRRTAKETEWLQSLRQSKGIHDPDISFGVNDSRIYSQYTRSKETPLRAKLNHHLLPAKEKNWEITPTPKPRLTDEQLQEIIVPLISKDDQSGAIIYPSEEQIELAIEKYSSEKAWEMSETINDQLVEGKYDLVQKASIKSGIRYGSGITKGPLVESYTISETIYESPSGATKLKDYLKGIFTSQAPAGGRWTQKQTVKYRPVPREISIWRFYPDMTATEIKQCGFVFELHSKTKHEMREMAKRPDFYGPVIEDILSRIERGNYKLRSWETDVQSVPENGAPIIVPGSQELSGKGNLFVDTPNYEVLERNGFIDGTDLVLAGIIDDADPMQEYFCSFWICDNKCIKLNIWPSEYIKDLSELYHIFYYEKDETSVFGTGLPKIIRDRQLAMNAGERNMLSHAAWLKGPCGEINLSILHPDSATNAQAFGPLTILGKIGYGNDAGKKVLDLYHIEDHMQSYINLMDFQRSQGDQEASLPSGLFGTPSNGAETAKGISVRFENLLDFIKDLAKNFDESNISYIKGVYRWNMAFNPDPEIKGDLDIKAVGSAQALIRDAVREAVAFFMQSIPDEMKQYFRWEEFAKELCKSLFDDPEKFIYTEEEVRANQVPIQAKQAEIDALQRELAIAKGRYDLAKADHMTAKADEIKAEMPYLAGEKALSAEKAKTDITKANVDNLQSQVTVAKDIRGDDDETAGSE